MAGLTLPVLCDSITWPDLSALRVLKLIISDKTNWKLDTPLPHLSLESFTMESYSGDDHLVFEDCVANAYYYIYNMPQRFINNGRTPVGIDGEGLEAITKALAGS